MSNKNERAGKTTLVTLGHNEEITSLEKKCLLFYMQPLSQEKQRP